MNAYRKKIRQNLASGAALVEASLFVIVLFIMLLGIVNVGRIYVTRIAMTNAAREGARWAAGNPTDNTGIATSAMEELKSSKLVPTNSTLGAETTSGGETSVPIDVTETKQFFKGNNAYFVNSTTTYSTIRIKTVTDSSSTSGQKVVVGVAYGFRPYMGSMIGITARTMYIEAQMIVVKF